MNKIDILCTTADKKLTDILKILDLGGKNNMPAGIALIVDDKGCLIGTVTDGDVRRTLINSKTLDIDVKDIMQKDPITFPDSYSINELLEALPKELEKRNRRSNKFLSKLILVDKDNKPARIIDYHQLWEQKVARHRHLVIIGLGYVGLTMGLAFADKGFKVTGIDTDESRLNMLKAGKSYVHEIGLPELLRENINKNFFVSKDLPEDGDVYVISVGTPIMKNNGKKEPDLSFLESALETISKKLNTGDLIILRSTVPIGTSRDYAKRVLEEKTGLRCGIDFHLAFAPERTAEGKALKELHELPQIIGGFNQDSTEATAALFKEITQTIIRVDSLEAAEMAKLINNTFRDYVFAFANKLSQIAYKYNINIFDVIKAANEGYPRDPVPYPSPGVGGPCLTKDPFILSHVAKGIQMNGEIFESSRSVNESMHKHVFDTVEELVKSTGKELKDCNVLVCGLAFKGNPETGDLRNSTSIEIADLFRDKVKNLFGYDAIADEKEINEFGFKYADIPDGFKNIDVVMFLNNHKSFEKIDVFNMTRMLNESPVIYDAWGLFRSDEILNTKPCIYASLSHYKSTVEA